MGGEGDPAKSAIEAALAAKKSVVTANKALLARHGVALAALAEKNGVAVNFEAAVAGAIPVVKTLREGLAGNSFARVYGILNGTCNYILTRMEQEKLSFADCLKDAQRLGYAEADPTFDVEGHDTAQKLVDPGEPRLRNQGRSGRGLCRRHFIDRAGRSRSRRRTRLSREASWRCRANAAGHRAARASDHGAEEFRHRAGDGRDQCRHHRCRRIFADHARRPGRGRSGDRIRGGRRHRRHRARTQRLPVVRPSGRATDRSRPRADAAPRGRLLHSPAGCG